MIFIDNINQFVSDSEAEIAKLKKILVKLRDKPEDRLLISKYSIPAFYSIWEGFFVKSLTQYIDYINSLKLENNDYQEILLAHNLDITFHLNDNRVAFEQKQKLSTELYLYYSSSIIINRKIITESNVNFKVANAMFKRLCLDELDESRKSELNKLLMYRNNIAHGECSLPIDNAIIDELSEIVINCIYDTKLIIEKGILSNSFKK